MTIKLQEIAGLTEEDPLHNYLGVADRFSDIDWTDIRLTRRNLLTNLWIILNPKIDEIQDVHINKFVEYLEKNNEPDLAEIITKLQLRKGEKGLDNGGIRAVIIFLAANIDLLKEKYLESGPKYNKISSKST